MGTQSKQGGSSLPPLSFCFFFSRMLIKGLISEQDRPRGRRSAWLILAICSR